MRELTGGKGVEVSFDGVGLETWEMSLTATARRGLIVSYGNASGPVSGVNLATLAQKGSLYVSRPTLFEYYHNPAERAAGAEYVLVLIHLARSRRIARPISSVAPLLLKKHTH